jgi:hypothetical protein
LKLARDNLIQLADYAASKGMTISFAIYPWPRFAKHPGNRGRTAWAQIAAEQKWTLVDLYPDFAASSESKFYIPRDVHWSTAGHRFVANACLAHYCELRHPAWCNRLAQTVEK